MHLYLYCPKMGTSVLLFFSYCLLIVTKTVSKCLFGTVRDYVCLGMCVFVCAHTLLYHRLRQ